MYTTAVRTPHTEPPPVSRDLEGADFLVVLVKDFDGHGPGAGPADELQLRAELRDRDALVEPLLAGERCDVGGYRHVHHVPRDHFVSLLAQFVITHPDILSLF